MIFIFALSALGVQGFRHREHEKKPMGADDWSTELDDIDRSISSKDQIIITESKVIGQTIEVKWVGFCKR